MGCTDSREAGRTPGKQTTHPFSEIDADLLCKELVFNSRGGLVSLKHFRRVCANLAIDFRAVTAYHAFYEALLQQDSAFKTSELFLVSVLLSKGSFSVKSQLWFEFVDSEALDLLDGDSLAHAIAELIRVGAEIIPLIAGGVDSSLKHYQENLCRRILNSFPRKALGLADIQNLVPADLFTSGGICELLQTEQLDPFPVTDSMLSTAMSPSHQTKSEFFFKEGPEAEESGEVTSENSEEPVIVEVQLSNERSASIVFHHTDDPNALSEEFSTRYSLTIAEKTRFLNTLQEIRYSLGYE